MQILSWRFRNNFTKIDMKLNLKLIENYFTIYWTSI